MGNDFSSVLRPGERVMWSGGPAKGLRFTPRDLFLVPFSVLWCGIAITGVAGTWQARPDLFFTLFGLVFVAVGLMATIGRFAIDAWLRGRTRYALTDRRVLIERDGPGGMLHALDLAALGDVALAPGRRGSGTIRLGPKPSFFGRGNGLDIWVPALDPTPQLLAIPDARRVFDLILTQRERLGTALPHPSSPRP